MSITVIEKKYVGKKYLEYMKGIARDMCFPKTVENEIDTCKSELEAEMILRKAREKYL